VEAPSYAAAILIGLGIYLACVLACVLAAIVWSGLIRRRDRRRYRAP
jgi:uncharacterized membrane protein YccC